MKKWLFPFFCVLFIGGYNAEVAHCQDTVKVVPLVGTDDDANERAGIAPARASSANDVVSERAILPTNWAKLIASKINYPSEAIDHNISASIRVAFVIDVDGSITNVTTEGPRVGYGLEAEAIRIIRSMPKVTPAKKNGVPVKSSYKQTIRFVLSE